MKSITILLLIILVRIGLPQTYNDFAPEIFFGRLASAKAEAMGRMLSVNYDSYFVSQSNPASLMNNQGLSVFYSNSSPFYGLRDAVYNYAGASYNNPEYGAIGFNALWFDYGTIFYTTGEHSPDIISSFKPSITVYTITYSNELLNWFNFGINGNLFINNAIYDKTFRGTYFDVGILKNINVLRTSELSDEIVIALMVKNIFNQSLEYEQNLKDYFPSILLLGLSNTIAFYNHDLYDKSHLIALTTGIEYQDLLNSKSRTAYKAAAEISFLDIVFARAGYYYERQINFGYNSKEKIEDLTYGFGFKLDMYKLLSKKLPLLLIFDYVSLKQPSYITDYDDWEKFSSINIVLNYQMNLK